MARYETIIKEINVLLDQLKKSDPHVSYDIKEQVKQSIIALLQQHKAELVHDLSAIECPHDLLKILDFAEANQYYDLFSELLTFKKVAENLGITTDWRKNFCCYKLLDQINVLLKLSDKTPKEQLIIEMLQKHRTALDNHFEARQRACGWFEILHYAAQHGCRNLFAELLTFKKTQENLGANASIYLPGREDVLCFATKNRHIKMVAELLQLENKSLLERTTENKLYALNIAVHNNDVDMVRLFLSTPSLAPMLVLNLSSDYMSAFTDAVRFGDFEIVKEFLLFFSNSTLLKDNQQLLTRPNNNEIFRYAVKSGKLELVRYFLSIPQIRANVLGINPQYGTPGYDPHPLYASSLYMAIYSGNPVVLAELLAFKPVQDVIASDDNYLLRAACTTGNLDMVNQLLACQPVRDSLASVAPRCDCKPCFLSMRQTPLFSAMQSNASGKWLVIDRLLEFQEMIVLLDEYEELEELIEEIDFPSFCKLYAVLDARNQLEDFLQTTVARNRQIQAYLNNPNLNLYVGILSGRLTQVTDCLQHNTLICAEAITLSAATNQLAVFAILVNKQFPNGLNQLKRAALQRAWDVLLEGTNRNLILSMCNKLALKHDAAVLGLKWVAESISHLDPRFALEGPVERISQFLVAGEDQKSLFEIYNTHIRPDTATRYWKQTAEILFGSVTKNLCCYNPSGVYHPTGIGRKTAERLETLLQFQAKIHPFVTGRVERRGIKPLLSQFKAHNARLRTLDAQMTAAIRAQNYPAVQEPLNEAMRIKGTEIPALRMRIQHKK